MLRLKSAVATLALFFAAFLSAYPSPAGAVSTTRPGSHTPSESLPSQLRTLVILLGQPRGGQLAWRSLHQNLLRPMHADLATIFTDVWKGNELSNRAKYTWWEPEHKDWVGVLEKASDQCSVPRRAWMDAFCAHAPPKWTFLGGVADCHPTGPQSAGILVALRYLLHEHILRERLADQYDWFVLTRADHVHLCRHPPLSQLTSSGMWVPTKEHWNGWTDRHLVATATNFVRALNMTSEILCNPAAWRERMKDMDFINIEVLQKLAWDHNGLHVNQFPRTMFTVRAENDSSKWSQGCNDDDMHNFCLKIKYPEAKREALKTCANLIPGFDVREALSALVSPRVACGGHKPAPVEPDTWCPSGA